MRSPKLRLLFWCGLIAGLGFPLGGTSRVAAEQPAAEQPAAEQPAAEEPAVAPVPGAATVSGAADGAGKPVPLWDRLIYLPYKNLKTVFNKGDATVLIPYSEYLQLKKRSEKMRAEGPPVTAVITEAHYIARVEKDLARITATLTVQVLDKPWAEVGIAFGDAAVGKISSDDGKALLRGTGKGAYSLLLPTKGVHKVTLELVARVHTSPDGRTFRFDCPPVGITTFELVVPEADQTIEITPKRVVLPVELAADEPDAKETGAGEADDGEIDPAELAIAETRVRSSLGSTSSISARWYPRTGLKPDMALLASVTNSLDVSIADGLVHTSATLTYRVLRGELSQLRIAVPLGHRILDVSAPGAKVKGWKGVDEEKRQLITIDLLSSVRDEITVEVHTERTLPEGPFDVAGILEDGTVNGIHALDAVRENGLLAVSHDSETSLSVDDQQGLIRVDGGQLPAANLPASPLPISRRRAGALFYKFYSPRFRLNVSVNPVEPRIAAQQTTQLIFGDDELRLESLLALTVERAGIFEIRVQLPEQLTVDKVHVDGMKEYSIDDETHILRVSLEQKRQGAISLSITGQQDFDPDAARQDQRLPLLVPLDVARETGSIFVFAPPSIEVITEAENVKGAYPEPTSSAGNRGAAAIVSAWSYSRSGVEIPFQTRRKPTRLTANVGTTIDVRQQLVHVATRIDYRVEFAGIDTFRFQVPEAVSQSVQIESAAAPGAIGIKQRLPAEEAADGWITWTVVMQQDVTGTQPLRITYDLKRDADDDKRRAEVSVEPLRVLGLEAAGGRPAVDLSGILGEVVIVKDRALAVSADASGGDLEPIDVRELRIAGLRRDGFLAFRYHKQPVTLALTAEKHDIQEVIETVVPRALVEIVIGRDRMATYRCRYRIISSQRQRLAVDLPQDFEPLGVLVDGNPVTLEKNGGGKTRRAGGVSPLFVRRFVNVARRKASNEPFYLTLLFRAPVVNTQFSGDLGGNEKLPLPRIGGDAPSAVAVQQLRTVVWIPKKYALVGSPENFVLETRARLAGTLWGALTGDKQTNELESWIGGGLGGNTDLPTEGHAFRYSSLAAADEITVTYYRMSYLAWVLSGTLLGLAFVLLKTSWENKLGFLLVVGFAAALIALGSPDGVFHGLVAARYGLAAMITWWLIQGLASATRLRSNSAAPPVRWTAPPGGTAAAVIPPPGVFEQFVSDRGPSGQH